MFIVKKLLSALLMPMSLGLGIVAAGLVLLWFTRRQRAARITLTVGFCLLTIFSYSGMADLLLAPLEDDFHPLLVAGTTPDAADEQAKNARFIVVLGGGHSLDNHLPPNTELSEMTLARLI